MTGAEHIDYSGIGVLIGAIAGFITVVGSFVLQVVTFIRQTRMQRDSKARDVKLGQLHDLLNGKSEDQDTAADEIGPQ